MLQTNQRRSQTARRSYSKAETGQELTAWGEVIPEAIFDSKAVDVDIDGLAPDGAQEDVPGGEVNRSVLGNGWGVTNLLL